MIDLIENIIGYVCTLNDYANTFLALKMKCMLKNRQNSGLIQLRKIGIVCAGSFFSKVVLKIDLKVKTIFTKNYYSVITY